MQYGEFKPMPYGRGGFLVNGDYRVGLPPNAVFEWIGFTDVGGRFLNDRVLDTVANVTLMNDGANGERQWTLHEIADYIERELLSDPNEY
jgi:hypothetical protein